MTLDITQDDAVVSNDTTVRGAPAVRISGSRVWFTNKSVALVESSDPAAAGIEIVGADAVIVNEVNARIAGDTRTFSRFAISGSAGADRIENAGQIDGRIALGDGADSIFNSGSLLGDVEFGAGDDLYVRIGRDAAESGLIDGGAGFDRYVVRGPIVVTNEPFTIRGFEQLVLEGEVANLFGYSGFTSVVLSPGASHNFTDSDNPDADLALSAGAFVRVGVGSAFRNVAGSAGAEQFEVRGGSRINGAVDMGDGNDSFWYLWDPSVTEAAPIIVGSVNGGAGRDTINLSVQGGRTVDVSRFSGFEILNAGTFTSATTNARLTGLNGFAVVDADNGGTLTIGGTDNAGLTVSAADNARLTIEAGSTIGQIDYPPNGFNFDRGTVTQARDVFSVVTNNGRVAGDVKLTTGRDTYDGRGGSVGGTVFGYAGDDVLTGGSGADRLDGGFGNDVLSGGAGDDVLAGGEGNDDLDGGLGADTLRGGAGNDIIRFSAVQSGSTSQALGVIDGGADYDILDLSGVSPVVAGTVESSPGAYSPGVFVGSQRFTISGVEKILLGGSNDTIHFLETRETVEVRSGAGSDSFFGSGNYLFFGEEGDDSFFISGTFGDGTNGIVDGGAGNDTLRLNIGFNVDLAAGQATSFRASYVVSGIENVVATVYDVITTVKGDEGDNLFSVSSSNDDGRYGVVFKGAGGNDALTGSAGDDDLDGGTGNDTLIGNGGADTLLGGDGDDRLEGGDGDDTLDGGAGNDVLSGGAGNDLFRLQGGGDDVAFGGAGDDGFYFGAALTAADRSFGGAGSDQVGLQGDYASGVTFGMDTLVDVETLVLLPGSDTRFGDTSGAFYSYAVRTADANVARGTTLTVNMNTLRAGENVSFDGSAETDGTFLFYGGSGSDVLSGGGGSDAFFFGTGKFGAGDRVMGNGGVDDQLGFQGNFAGANAIVLGQFQVMGIETIVLLTGQDARFGGGGAAFSYDLTLNDGNAAAFGSLVVNGNTLRADETLRVDGSAETDARLTIFAGAGADILIGGRGGDEIRGAGGNDTIRGGGGVDMLYGGAGNDVFVYVALSDSTPGERDFIRDFADGDRIDVSGIDARSGTAENDAFSFIGSGAFTRNAGELRVIADPSYTGSAFRVEADVDGDGFADFAVTLTDAARMPIMSDFIL